MVSPLNRGWRELSHEPQGIGSAFTGILPANSFLEETDSRTFIQQARKLSMKATIFAPNTTNKGLSFCFYRESENLRQVRWIWRDRELIGVWRENEVSLDSRVGARNWRCSLQVPLAESHRRCSQSSRGPSIFKSSLSNKILPFMVSIKWTSSIVGSLRGLIWDRYIGVRVDHVNSESLSGAPDCFLQISPSMNPSIIVLEGALIVL